MIFGLTIESSCGFLKHLVMAHLPNVSPRADIMKTELKFINRSYDRNLFPIVVFQKNKFATKFEVPIAWKVIRNCRYDWWHPIAYSQELACSFRDAYGNQSPIRKVRPGRKLQISHSRSGAFSCECSRGEDPTTIEVENGFKSGTVNVDFYRSGNLVVYRQSIAPQCSTHVDLGYSIFIAPIFRVEEGQRVLTTELCGQSTCFCLLGISRAEIIMTGGGPGPYATPFKFHLHNISA